MASIISRLRRLDSTIHLRYSSRSMTILLATLVTRLITVDSPSMNRVDIGGCCRRLKSSAARLDRRDGGSNMLVPLSPLSYCTLA